METTCSVMHPRFATLIVAAALASLVPQANAQTPPTEGNTRDLGLIADPGDPIIFSATTPTTNTPVFLYVFDNDATSSRATQV